MDYMNDIKEKLCKEVEQIALKKELSAGDLETVHKLTDTIKNIDKIEKLEHGGYSNGGDWEAEMRGTYGRGSSYRGRDSMGRFTRDTRGGRRGGRYSRTDARDHMMDMLEDMMDTADDREREILRRAMQQLDMD